MANTNERSGEHPPIFLNDLVSTSDGSSVPNSPPSRRRARRGTAGRSGKGERYELTAVEKGIRRRVRRDGTGKPAYEVSVWVSGRALSRTFSVLRDARRWRDEMLGNRATGNVRIPKDRSITVAEFVTAEWSRWLDEQVRFGHLQPTTVRWYKYGARRLVAELGRVKLANKATPTISSRGEAPAPLGSLSPENSDWTSAGTISRSRAKQLPNGAQPGRAARRLPTSTYRPYAPP